MTKSFKDFRPQNSTTDVNEACWVGYKKVGMKKKGDRMVPNCVKEELVNAVYGKDYVYREPVMEDGVADFYKGSLNKNQLANLKNVWKNKKSSDVNQKVKDHIKNLDQFTRISIKQANIKYLSNLINDEVNEDVDFISPLQDQLEIIEMNSVVRKTELKEFTDDQINRLAKAYNVMKDKTISLANAQKLGKMMDGVPDNSLNAIRKKNIPFLSGLALSRMIQRKIPVTEDLEEQKKQLEEEIEFLSDIKDTMIQEKIQQGFAVRFFDPSNGKRFAAAYPNKKDAQDKAAQLKKDGLKDISITQHTLNFKEENNEIV